MKQVVKETRLPVFTIEIDSSECRFKSVEEIAEFLREEIEAHKAARYIATFDHLKHTRNLPEGQIAEEIVAAYNVVFCFGFTLQGPEQLATRPRSIGVCQSGDRITISFVEAPMPVANALMEQWARSLLHKKAPAPPLPEAVAKPGRPTYQDCEDRGYQPNRKPVMPKP